MKRITKLAVPISCFLLVALGAFTHVLGNLYWRLTDGDSGFFVPQESSVFTFQWTENSGGNALFWVRGEDWSNFYILHGTESAYLVFPKAAVAKCAGFDPANLRTWCMTHATKHPYGD